MAVLDCLASAANSVVTRQELFDRVWPGAAISDEVLTQRIAELRKAFEDSAHQSTIIETIPKMGFRLIPPVVPLSDEPVAKQGFHRAAVLPFVNMSEDPANEYFSDGISEELINLLVKVPGLEVISRTSSFSFKGESWKMADLVRELNASLIVEGTVRKVDNRVRITAQLIDPNTDRHLWSESYDRELSDIFSLQREIAQAIVTALQEEIGAHTVLGTHPTANIDAYELLLLGRHYFYQRGVAMDKAIKVLKMAVEEDPEFAEAWAYLAAAAVVSCYYRTSISNEHAWLIAEQAASTSLKLDPGMGLALASQAMLAYLHERNLAKGFQLIDRAADEHPHDTTIRLWAGMHYWYCGYFKEARSHFLYAHTRDPRVGITNGNLGLLYLALGLEDLAVPRLAKATELGYPNHHHALASLLMRRGDLDAAFAELKVTLAGPGAHPDRLPWIGELEQAGRAYMQNPESADVLISILERAPEGGATEKARLALLFDLKDPFFEYLSFSVEEGPLWLPYLVPTLWLPEYRAYVEDPRFLEIMRRDGALEVWEHRGFPDGCIRVKARGGDYLDWSMRYQ
jgi:TolB-like protein/Tfp pilus assembly protein PilF